MRTASSSRGVSGDERADHADEDIAVGDGVPEDLRLRLARTRWPDELVDAKAYGVLRSTASAISARDWAQLYDWRATEARFNAWPEFETTIDCHKIHFFWIRCPNPTPIPMLLTHGWPGSVAESWRSSTARPASAHAGRATLRSTWSCLRCRLRWSGPTAASGWTCGVSPRVARLMRRLGYRRYAAQGGDFGSMVSARLARWRRKR